MAAERVCGMDERQLRTLVLNAQDVYSMGGSWTRFFAIDRFRCRHVELGVCQAAYMWETSAYKTFGSYHDSNDHWFTVGSGSEAIKVVATWLAVGMLCPFDYASMELCGDGESLLGRLPVLDVKRAISAGATPRDPSYRDRLLVDMAMQKEFGLVDVHRSESELSALIWVAGRRDRGEVRDAVKAIYGRNEFRELDLTMYTGACVIAAALVTGSRLMGRQDCLYQLATEGSMAMAKLPRITLKEAIGSGILTMERNCIRDFRGTEIKITRVGEWLHVTEKMEEHMAYMAICSADMDIYVGTVHKRTGLVVRRRKGK